MTARKKCCKYCKHSTLYENTWTYGCSVLQEYVNPMSVCNNFSLDVESEFDISNQIED